MADLKKKQSLKISSGRAIKLSNIKIKQHADLADKRYKICEICGNLRENKKYISYLNDIGFYPSHAI